MNRVKRFNIDESIVNQIKVVETGLPAFAPREGICWNCNKQIYAPYINGKKVEPPYPYEKFEGHFVSGITTTKSKKLVTGCPHCSISYCE